MAKRPDWRAFTQDDQERSRQNRRAGGWKAKKAGESAEELLMLVGKQYLAEERAELRKRPEPYRRIGSAQSNGQFMAAPLSKSGPDFDLALPDGRSGLIEVKSRKGHRIPLHAVGAVQSEALARRIAWQGFGVIMVMLWDEKTISRWWAVDYRRWAYAREIGYKSFSDKDLDLLAIRCDMMIGARPDWLPALFKSHIEAESQLWPLDTP
jgi:hypothetical protein